MANEMESAVDALMHIVHSRPGTPPAEDQKPIQAYAKLQGEDFVYYIRSLSVLLGRKTSPYDEVQVDLGNSKIVSRVHARIEYNFVTRSFELSCMGKNGVFIDGKFFGKDASAVPLETKTLIQIGEKWFYFLLPVSTIQQGPLSDQNRRFSSHTYGSRSSGREGSPGATVPNSPSSSRGGSPGDDGDIPDYKIYPDIKPPFSYASMIAQAINSSMDKRLSLSSIYQYITDNYPYYRTAQNGWQNSIRHNLSLNKAFIKMARTEHEPGKGAFWAIDPQYAHQFQDGNFTSPNVKQRKPSQNVSPNTVLSKSEDQLSETSEEPARKRARVSVDSSEPLVTPAAEEPQSEAPKEAEEAAPVATETAPAEEGAASNHKE